MVLSQNLETVKIFFSLAPAPEDRTLFEKLCKHLSSLWRRDLIKILYDSEIAAGSDLKNSIQSYINSADIIVLLISADFLASDQCFDREMRYAQEQNILRATPVIPVLLRPTELRGLSLAANSLLPSNGKAVSVWDNLDTALEEVVQGIHRVIDKFMSHLIGSHGAIKQPQFPLSTLPHRRNPFFTNRIDTLTTLHAYFTTPQSGQTRTQALHGLGGIGKTLLAIEYAWRYQDEYQAVLWLNATPHELLGSDILSLAQQLGIPTQNEADEQQRILAIRRWLQHHDRWLLVLDNLDNFLITDQLIPPYSNGHVLLITHSQATGAFASAVFVDQMTIDEGALLLLRRAKIIPTQGARSDASEAHFLQATEIAQEVEGYPLALDQAGAYIEETQLTPAAYLSRYRQREAAFLGMRGRLASDHPDPVTNTLALTFEKIAQTDPNALELLRFFAFLHPDALPDEMILYGAASLSGPLRTIALDPILLDSALATLQRFSLVQRQADATTLKIQRIVQTILKKDLTKKHQHQLAIQAVRLINFTFPAVNFKTWAGCKRYLPQALHCATLIHDFQLTLKEGGLLLERLGSYYNQQGCYREAETYLTQALQLQEHYQRKDPLDIAQTLNSLGLVQQRQAHYQDARTLHQRALMLREQELAPDHPKLAESLHNLAMLHDEMGEYQQAEQLYQRALSLEERSKGSDHPDVASTLNNLALLYYQQGDYAQAEATYQRVLAIYKHALPANHPDLIYPLEGLGTLAEIQGDYQQAAAFYQQALDISKEAYGEKHPDTAHSINKLADLAESQGNYQQAEALYQQALSIGEQALGMEHPDVALFLNNLAFLVVKQGQYQRAEELYLQALQIYEQARGPEHPDVANILDNLGQLYRKTGDGARAEALLQRSLLILEQALGTTHSDTIQTRNNLTELLTDQHNPEEPPPLQEPPQDNH